MRALILGLLVCAMALAGLTALAPVNPAKARQCIAGKEG